MKKYLLIIPILVILGFIYYKETSMKNFPPVGVACFDSFVEETKSGYADPVYNIPSFSMDQVIRFRCASQKGFSQYEITATDTDGHLFYIHRASGGMAASGADTYFDHCYKKDGKLLRSSKLTGRTTLATGTCAYIESFPENPTSNFEYTK